MRRILYTLMAAFACMSCIHKFPEPDTTPEEGQKEEKTKVTLRVSKIGRAHV